MRSRTDLPSSRLSLIVLIVAVLAVLAPRMASASSAHRTYYVAPGGNDAAACAANSATSPFATIQAALACAGDGDVVDLAPSARPYPGIGAIAAGVTVQAQPGADARSVTIDAGRGELLVAPGANVTVAGATIACPGNDCAATATVTNEGDLTLSADAVTGNQSLVGAVVNTTPAGSTTPATLLISHSTISGNAERLGGGVESSPGPEASGAVTLTISDSTIVGNFAQTIGGGVASIASTAGSQTTIVNSTIARNTAQNGGGGLYATGPATLGNTIVAANAVRSGTTPDCEGATIADGAGHNLIGNGTGCSGLLDAVNGDEVGVPHPGLLAPGSNGGPTETVALQSGSPAIGAGDPGACSDGPVLGVDQRGEPRPYATAGCDIGAYDTGGHGGVVRRSYYVAPGGSDATTCSANNPADPFATVQAALACAGDGDVVDLAPSARPYPGIGAIAANVTIQAATGGDARTVTVDAGRGELSVRPGVDATIAGISLACPAGDCAAATVTNEGRLSLIGDSVIGNQSAQGGVVNTTPSGSSTSAALLVEDSTISGNASRFGGGIESVPGAGASGALVLTVADSTISHNFSQTLGGGIAAVATTAGSSTRIVSSTISANIAQSGGGGIDVAGVAALTNTVLAGNTVRSGSTPDCQGQAVGDGAGHNLIGDGTGCSALADGVDGDHVGTATDPLDPGLAPLAFNGGATETQPPLPMSPAVGAGAAAPCTGPLVGDLDQRGVRRRTSSRGACDIGAVDGGGRTTKTAAPRFTVAKAATATVGSPFALELSATGTPTPAFGETGMLPAGLTLRDNGDGTAALAGTPTGGAASYTITFVAENGIAPAVTQVLTLTVAPLTVTNVTGKPAVAGSGAKTITIRGSGFQPGATLSAFAPGLTFSKVKVKSPTEITAKLTAEAGVGLGSYDLTVAEPGVTASCSGCLLVGSGGKG